MSDDLIPMIPEANLPTKYTEDDLSVAMSSSNYLPRIDLKTSSSECCKSGEFPINSYALVTGTVLQDLGKQVDLLVVAARPKAIDMSGEQVIAVYDPKIDAVTHEATGEFRRIQDKSAEKNSKCMYGLDFLVWIPQIKKFATFFMGSASARRESPNLKARLRQAATISSQKIETKAYTWWAPKILACSTPFEMPATESILAELEKFNNPPAIEMEPIATAAEGSGAGTAAGRAR